MTPFAKPKKIHFVGIGGIGMSGIAEVLINLGHHISGSDLAASETTNRLASFGAKIFIGHDPANVGEADVVVTSSAVAESNPEVIEAKSRFIPVISRAEMLAELMRMKYGIAVAGAHGKTTTTSLLATVLGRAGKDPTVVIGGRLNSIGSNAKLGQGFYLVAEADESDGSFLMLTPTIAVVTNIDAEHMDHYGGMENLKNSFLAFANKVPFYGLAVLCLDQEIIQSLLPSLRKRYVTYGFSHQAQYRAEDVILKGFSTTLTVLHHQRGKLGKIHLEMPGFHNAQNALAAVAVADELGISFEEVATALDGFTGVQRRFDLKGEIAGVMVVDDYAHHPTEIKAVLSSARKSFDRRIVAIFQPHRYSRVRDLFDDFCTSFNDADLLIVTQIYPAGEKMIEGVTAKKLFDGIRACGHRNVIFVPELEAIPKTAAELCKTGDLVITLGAGSVTKIGPALLSALQKPGKAVEESR